MNEFVEGTVTTQPQTDSISFKRELGLKIIKFLETGKIFCPKCGSEDVTIVLNRYFPKYWTGEKYDVNAVGIRCWYCEYYHQIKDKWWNDKGKPLDENGNEIT